MKWLTKISQQWWNKNISSLEHIYNALQYSLQPMGSWKEKEDPSEIYFFGIRLQNNQIGRFFFLHNGFVYKLLSRLIPAYDLKIQGLQGTLYKTVEFNEETIDVIILYDLNSDKKLGEIKENNPKDFVKKVIELIKSDFDEGGSKDVFPTWPYPEDEIEPEKDKQLVYVRERK